MTATPAEVLPDRRYIPWYRRCVPSWRTVVIALLLILSMPFALRWYRLSLLPDVPVPFDVEAFTPVDLPVEENAYFYFNQLAPVPQPTSQWYMDYCNDSAELFRKGETFVWLDVPLDVQAIVLQVQPKIDLNRAGGRCAESSYIPIQNYTISVLLPSLHELLAVQRLIPLDIKRRLSEDDIHGAAEELHDAFRVSRHSGRRGSWIERLVGMSSHSMVARSWHEWSRHPGVTAGDLEAALERLREDWKITPPISDHQKVLVVMLLNETKPPMTYYRMGVDNWTAELMSRALRRPGQASTLVSQASAAFPGWQTPILWVLGEPEMSSRAAKLWLTQELRYCDLPQAEQPSRLPGRSGVFDTSDLTAGLSATTLEKRMNSTMFTENRTIFHLQQDGRRETTVQLMLETELRLQILFRQFHDITAGNVESILADFSWPVDPAAPKQDKIRHRADDGGLVIWSRGVNGIDNGAKSENRPVEDDIAVTIPWPKLP